jgi:pilus assembly protein CpaF
MTPQPPPVPMPSPLSAATLGKVRRMLVARLTPEVLNPFDRTPEREQLVRTTIAAILEDPELELAPVPALVAAVEAAVCGLGPLQSLVEDPEVSDILVNAPDAVFAERAGRLEPAGVRLASDAELIEIAERIAALAGRELSVAHPIVDARMADGSRVNAVLPPVGGPYLAIRKFNRLRLDLTPGSRHGRDWVTEGGLSPDMADFLSRLVRAKANVLVAGETGAGKTTLLRSLTDLFEPSERVGVVEDTAELALENPDRFNLETVHPHDLATGEAESRLLDVGDLVANALRMRPDRLIVGEIRLPKEAFYTLQALHTGHDGSATTIHASSAEDALFRLELLARQSMRDLTVTDLRTYIARVFDLVVVLRRLRSGRRIVRQIAALDGIDAEGYRLADIFTAELPAPDEVRFVRDLSWQPSERLRARLEAEGEQWT